MQHVHDALLRFQGLSARERWLALAAAVVALTVLLDTAWLGPQRRTVFALTQQLQQSTSEREAMSAVLSTPRASAAPDANTAERDDLRLRLARTEATVAPALSQARLAGVVRSLVAERSSLALVSLKTLAPEAIDPITAPPIATQNALHVGDARAQSSALYKHGVEVVVRGPYPALLAYLADMQEQQSGIFWAKVKLDVQAYPLATLAVTIYTVNDRPDARLG